MKRRIFASMNQRWTLRVVVVAAFTTLFFFFIPSHSRSNFLKTPFRSDPFDNDIYTPFDAWNSRTHRLSIPELKKLIAGKEGYYVRDWSVGLGWNNLRYIIEASLLHAKLTNRVLVLPSFVYVRGCEFDHDVCSQYGLFVDRSQVVGWDKWNGAKLSTVAWHLPIQIMMDLPHIRQIYPVILASEFFELHGLDPNFESLAGDWNRGDFENVTFPTIHTIPNNEYDSGDTIRVDTVKGLPTITSIDEHIDQLLKNAIGGSKTLSWYDAIGALKANGHTIRNDKQAERIINSGGWVVTYTFEGHGGMDYTKTVVDPLKEVVPRSRVHGFVEDFTVNKEVLLLEGETHLGRKPGGLRFTTQSARENFADLVLHGLRPVAPIRDLAHKLALRMRERVGGRNWMSAHMRRGDFTAVGWAMETDLNDHLNRIKNHLRDGRDKLQTLFRINKNKLPLENDPFFLATDERSEEGLAYLRNNSAVLVSELLTIEDRRTIGWPLLYTDVLGLVEQSLAAEAAFFYGHCLSSFAGGVLNIRAYRGVDRRTVVID